MKRRLLALLVLAGLAFVLRTNGGRRERVELFFEDGSVVTLGDEDAAPLLDIARTIL